MNQSQSKPLFAFPWLLDDLSDLGLVRANTKSEARSQIKQLLGIRSHGRLPVGIMFGERKQLRPRKERTTT